MPRDWAPIEHQRYPEEIITDAIPVATDGRFKAAALTLVACWLTILASLSHSLKHYAPAPLSSPIYSLPWHYLRSIPPRLLVFLVLSLALIAYQILTSFMFSMSPRSMTPDLAAVYAGGYAPSLLIVLTNVIWGFASRNEDKEIIRQRRLREGETDRELGIVKRPAWWRRAAAHNEGMADIIARNVQEVNGRASDPSATTIRETAAAATTAARAGGGGTTNSATVEMSPLSNPTSAAPNLVSPYTGRSDRRRSERTMEAAAGVLFPQRAAGARRTNPADLMLDGPSPGPLLAPPPPYSEREELGQPRGSGSSSSARPAAAGRSGSTATGDSDEVTALGGAAPPTKIRSMLDV
jgi:hypothetical protein